jgi:uncharacterized membrane protein YedE/YeeE
MRRALYNAARRPIYRAVTDLTCRKQKIDLMNLSVFLGPLLGGILLGISASLLYAFEGRVAGISGIIAGLLTPKAREWPSRVAFILGLFVAGTLAKIVFFTHRAPGSVTTIPVLVAAGLLVGFGARLGNGCTSGHGICGISRWNPRSIVATMVFILMGALVVGLVRHGLGGQS